MTIKAFGRYEIISPIGSGATSDVYLAHDTKLDRDVALKILKSALVADQVSFNRFTIEAQAAGKLFHDHIATVLDMGEIDGRYYIAMRYIDGQSLAQHLKANGPMKWDDVSRLVKQIGSAIAFAHSQGFLHRDIKPNNILMDKQGNFFLTDFGLTSAMHDSGMTSTTGAVIGTPPYIPPEIWNGLGASPRSDQYSFACVLNEAITGESIFDGGSPQEIITKHLIKERDLSNHPKGTPQNARYILQKALSREQTDRFDSTEKLMEAMLAPEKFDVMKYLGTIKGEQRSKTDKQDLEKMKNRRKRRLIFAIFVMLGIFSAVLGFVGAFPVSSLFGKEAAQTTEDLTEDELSAQMTADSLLQMGSVAEQQAPQEIAAPTTAPIISPSGPFMLGGDYEQIPHDAGIQVDYVNGASGLAVYLFDGDGNPIKDKYVVVYAQKQDLSGKAVTADRVKNGYSESDGGVVFDLPAGTYIVEADFDGYNWGSAGDVNGHANLQVQPGKQTRLVMRLGKLLVGFVNADGSVVEDKYVEAYTQQPNISDQWVADDRVRSGYTDNSGIAIFDLTPGNYVIAAEFDGENWGSAVDRMGEANIPVYPGHETRVILKLGQLIVAVKDGSGNPVNEKYVEVFYQQQDANGNPARGNRIRSRYTDNTGTASFQLTPGTYVIQYDRQDYFNITIESGKITTATGANIRVE